MSFFSPTESQGAIPCFLLELDYHGMIYRFAEQMINLSDGSNYKNYNNVLKEFGYRENSELIGIDVESNSVSCAVIFDSLDLVQEWRKGFSLEGQTAELSYVLLKDGIPQQNYSERIILYKGMIQSPVFGDPLEPLGFAAFSVERAPYDFSRTLIPPSKTINITTFTDMDENTAGGKPFPIVLGQPGQARRVDGTTYLIWATPAYMVKKVVGDYRFLIAGHPVQATQVKLRDNAFNHITCTVYTDTDNLGQVYSYVDVTGTGLMYPGKLLPPVATDLAHVSEWWVQWTNGGGMLNPFGEGMLKGGGDICRWALLTAGVEVDYGAWGNAAIVLNGYEFAGYINDAEVTAWDWVSSNILPFLPVEVKAGVKGIKPILALVFASTYLNPSTKITVTSDFIQVSAIETMQDTTELLNSVVIKFGKDGETSKYCLQARVGPNAANDSQDRDDIYSSTSFNRYGLLETAIESDYIYDRNTAFYIAHTMVKAKAFPMLSISYEASNNFGYLQVGDLIQITDSNLYLEEAYATVLAKEWRGDVWGYIIGISSAAITLPRTT